MLNQAKVHPLPPGPAPAAAPRSPTDPAAVAPGVEGVADTDDYLDATDVHVVGFEGSKNRVIVVDKRMTVMRWLAGSDEVDAAVNQCFETYQLTPIFLLLGWASLLTLLIAPLHEVRETDKAWYLVLLVGATLHLNMLSSRSPRLLRMAATNFDMVRQPPRPPPPPPQPCTVHCLNSFLRPPLLPL